jgi:hypothetical protein
VEAGGSPSATESDSKEGENSEAKLRVLPGDSTEINSHDHVTDHISKTSTIPQSCDQSHVLLFPKQVLSHDHMIKTSQQFPLMINHIPGVDIKA